MLNPFQACHHLKKEKEKEKEKEKSQQKKKKKKERSLQAHGCYCKGL
jgi:hypothetical protein